MSFFKTYDERGYRWCNKGKHYAPVETFTKCATLTDGLAHFCKPCRRKKKPEEERAKLEELLKTSDRA